jgi:hypothetical protein
MQTLMNALGLARSSGDARCGSGFLLLLLATLAGCGSAPKDAAHPEGAPPPPAPAAEETGASASPSAGPASEETPPNGAAAANSGAGSAEPPVQPKQLGAPVEVAVGGKHAGDASIERVIQGVKTGLQNCYEAGLKTNPTAMGTVEFRVHITASGSLKKVESDNPNTMPGSITSCMVGRFGALSFEPRPATTIQVKVTCRTAE